VQEALRLKESKAVDEVVAVSLGPQQVQVRLTMVSLLLCTTSNFGVNVLHSPFSSSVTGASAGAGATTHGFNTPMHHLRQTTVNLLCSLLSSSVTRGLSAAVSLGPQQVQVRTQGLNSHVHYLHHVTVSM
jgi:phosphate/sulfate permease